MRVHVRPPFSPVRDLQYPSACAAPRPAGVSAAALLFLLAFDSPTSDDAAAVGSLSLEPASFSTFAVQVSSLRLAPAAPEQQYHTAKELLRFAVRNEPCLRTGGALLTCATPTSTMNMTWLESLGFGDTGTAAGAIIGADDPGGGEELPADAPIMSFQSRLPADGAADVVGGGLAALRVSDIETSLKFWSLLQFAPTLAFTTSGARAACLAAPWSSQVRLPRRTVPHRAAPCGCDASSHSHARVRACVQALELVEVPAFMLPEMRAPNAEQQLGLTHVTIDLTPISVSLADTLRLLQERSMVQFGRTLQVLIAPHQQMLGRLVLEAVVVRAPDGVQLRLMRRSATLSQALEPDWTLA